MAGHDDGGLEKCVQFDGNLYWVDIHDSTRAMNCLRRTGQFLGVTVAMPSYKPLPTISWLR
jgi:hypothetical protein